MKMVRWGMGAMFAVAASAGAMLATDDLSAMKATMESMKAEMNDLTAERANLIAAREAMRSNAGGAPEGLRSANGNATIRIGGDFRVQYGMGWANGYGRTGIDGVNHGRSPENNAEVGNANFKSQAAGWAVNRAQLYFDIDLSCDTSAFIDLRLNGGGAFGKVGDGGNLGGNILNQAYWTWKNIGGSGFGLNVGLMDVPFGMWANTDMGGYAWDSVDRALITKPFVMDTAQTGAANSVGGFYQSGNPAFSGGVSGVNSFAGATSNELVNLGIFGSYRFDEQIIVKAGVMASDLVGIGRTTAQNNAGVNWDNEVRNIGIIDHVVALGYNPCWLEGLHIEAAYLGRFDSALGGWGNEFGGPTTLRPGTPHDPYASRRDYTGDTTYLPSFDLGVSYQVNQKLKLFAEGVMTWNPWYADGRALALSLGADYKLTEKLMLGLGYDYYTVDVTGRAIGITPVFVPNEKSQDIHRASIGGKYNFNNGLYFQMQYYHDFINSVGVLDGAPKSADAILFQTGYIF